MAKNKIQFQKGLSLTNFLIQYGNEKNATRHCSTTDGHVVLCAPDVAIQVIVKFHLETFCNATIAMLKHH